MVELDMMDVNGLHDQQLDRPRMCRSAQNGNVNIGQIMTNSFIQGWPIFIATS